MLAYFLGSTAVLRICFPEIRIKGKHSGLTENGGNIISCLGAGIILVFCRYLLDCVVFHENLRCKKSE